MPRNWVVLSSHFDTPVTNPQFDTPVTNPRGKGQT
jgi:hypothetical protein